MQLSQTVLAEQQMLSSSQGAQGEYWLASGDLCYAGWGVLHIRRCRSVAMGVTWLLAAHQL